MPSVDARNHASHFGEFGKFGAILDYDKPSVYENVEGITILDEEGIMKPEVETILEIISDHNAVIETSHLDVTESKALVEEARKKGVKIVVTHVGFITASISLEDQIWMAKKGALLELCYASIAPAWRHISIDEVVNIVKEVGPEHYILSSDLGQVHNPSPAEGLRIYIMMLLERGLTVDEIFKMVNDNPKSILGLD
jgi:predicted metal-dependent TIM-barrel fold hydrolase